MAGVTSVFGSRGVQCSFPGCQEILGVTQPSYPAYKVSVEEGVELITPELKPDDKSGGHLGLEDPTNWIKLGTLSDPRLGGEERGVEVFFKNKLKSKKPEWEALSPLQGSLPSLHDSLKTEIRVEFFPKKQTRREAKSFCFELPKNLCSITIEPLSQCGSKTKLCYLSYPTDEKVKTVASLKFNLRTYDTFRVHILQKTSEVTKESGVVRPSWSGLFMWLGYKRHKSH